jgi:hypothetical protein
VRRGLLENIKKVWLYACTFRVTSSVGRSGKDSLARTGLHVEKMCSVGRIYEKLVIGLIEGMDPPQGKSALTEMVEVPGEKHTLNVLITIAAVLDQDVPRFWGRDGLNQEQIFASSPICQKGDHHLLLGDQFLGGGKGLHVGKAP